MVPKPLYSAVAEPAYQLRYSWTGWPSGKAFSETPCELIEQIEPLWETDGLRLLEHRWTREMVQLAFSAKPHVAPESLAARAKGRLDHALRKAGHPVSFSRKLAVRSLGENSRQQVEAYIEKQVSKEQFADPQFARRMEQFTVANPDADLSMPFEAKRGRYWYNLHVVLIVADRGRLHEDRDLATIRDGAFKVADKKGYLISRLSVMPDHLHIALRGEPSHAPEQIALAFQNNLAYLAGCRLWNDGYYLGTFSEYDMGAVRAHARLEVD